MDVFSALKKLHENDHAAQKSKLKAQKNSERAKKSLAVFILSDAFIGAIEDKAIRFRKSSEIKGEYKGDRMIAYHSVESKGLLPEVIHFEIYEYRIIRINIVSWNVAIFNYESRAYEKRFIKLLQVLEKNCS